MPLLAKIAYAVAAVLAVLGVLVLLKVIALGAGWVALFVAAFIAAVVGYVLDNRTAGVRRL